MQQNSPRVVVGLLVYNGEKYLAETIDSILNQTFTDFSLLIADNASTDSTQAICLEYAKKDPRITYHRHAENIGSSGNHNFLFQPGDAPYFKWASHDDPLEPDYLQRCVELLDQDPTIGMVHSRSYQIDGNGIKTGTLDHEVRLNSFRPSERFWRVLWGGYLPEVHGVMRSELIKKTKLFQGFPGDDRSFLAEMLLQADIGYVEEYLFCRRDHAECFTRLADTESRVQFYNPKSKKSTKMIGLSKTIGYLDAIFRHLPSRTERAAAIQALLEWTLRRALEVRNGLEEPFGQWLREEFSRANQRLGHKSGFLKEERGQYSPQEATPP